MNWNKNNNDNNPWGPGEGKSPWSGGNSNNRDFEDTIKKAKERFGKFKIGGPRNISILIKKWKYLSKFNYRSKPKK